MNLRAALRPNTEERLPFVGGCGATGCLHVIVSVAVIAAGAGLLGREGGLLVLPFWGFLGIVQWAYVAPLALAFGRLGLAGARKGAWFGGVLVVLLNGLYWVGMGVATVVYRQQAAEVQRFAAAHPVARRELAGTVAVVDARHLEMQTSGGLVSVALRSTTIYLKEGGPEGRGRAAKEDVRVGATVVVEASSYAGDPLIADYVTVTGGSPAASRPPTASPR